MVKPNGESRNAPIRVVFSQDDDRVGCLIVGGETWGAVEWSEKRGVWCIEDAEGRCLRHASSIQGQAAAKEEAIALAEQMVRDGRMPSPEEAAQRRASERQREREKRAKQPSEIRRKQERAERNRLWDANLPPSAKRAKRRRSLKSSLKPSTSPTRSYGAATPSRWCARACCLK